MAQKKSNAFSACRGEAGLPSDSHVPSNVGKSCNHPQRADGWRMRPRATLSDCCAHSPHAAQRQNGAQLNYKQIDSHVAPLSSAWSPRARIDSKADRLHFLTLHPYSCNILAYCCSRIKSESQWELIVLLEHFAVLYFFVVSFSCISFENTQVTYLYIYMQYNVYNICTQFLSIP